MTEKLERMTKNAKALMTASLVGWLVVLACIIAGLVLKTNEFLYTQLTASVFALLMDLDATKVRLEIQTEVNKSMAVVISSMMDEPEEVPEEESEADTKETATATAIVSPEDFERFKKGEMTKEELLNIKKAVDKVTEMKQEA